MPTPTPQHDFRVYPTLLDAWRGYTHSNEVWETYWAFSDNPPHTPEQFHTLQLWRFIDTLNHVDGEPSEPASRGTAFNELVDCLVEQRPPTFDTEKVRGDDGHVTHIVAHLDGFSFTFQVAMLKQTAARYNGAVCQYLTQGTLDTRFGSVLLYGYIDELMPHCIHDIKTTGKYEFPKYKHSAQRLVYPFCCAQQGMDIRRFDFDVVTFPKYGESEYFTETYIFDTENDTVTLTTWVEEMLDFITEHPSLFTDKRFFMQSEERTIGLALMQRDPIGWESQSVEIYNEILNIKHLIEK